MELVDEEKRLSYSTLNVAKREIRLLTLSPAQNHNDNIYCQLETHSLPVKSKYAALSYVWGDPNQTKKIKVNGCAFYATRNLEAALRYLRDHIAAGTFDQSTPRYLWIDAICINQSDNAEKSIQVQRMGDVYRSADMVISWMGSGMRDNIGLALQTIKSAVPTLRNWKRVDPTYTDTNTFAPREKSTQGTSEMLHANEFDWYGQLPYLCPSNINSNGLNSCWEAIESFTKLEYWFRMWIVQEVVLANPSTNIWVYEDQTVSFQDVQLFSNLITDIFHHPSIVPFVNFRTEIIDRYMFTTGQLNRVIRKLALFKSITLEQDADGPTLYIPLLAQEYHVSNELDAIYGLASLFEMKDLVIDYSLKVEDCYISWFTLVLEKFQYPKCLGFGGIGYHRLKLDSKLPSWVPDLRSEHSSAAREHFFRGKKGERRGGPREGQCYTITGGTDLHVSAAFFEDVMIVRSLHSTGDNLIAPWVEFYMKCLCGSRKTSPYQESSIISVLWKCFIPPIDDSPEEWEFNSAFRSSLSDVCFFAQIMLLSCSNSEDRNRLHDEILNDMTELPPGTSMVPGFEENNDQDTIERNLLDYVSSVHLARVSSPLTLFKSKSGYIGIGPPRMRVDDKIFYMDQLERTFIVREVDSRLRLVGACRIPCLFPEDMIEAGDLLVEEITLS